VNDPHSLLLAAMPANLKAKRSIFRKWKEMGEEPMGETRTA